MIKYIDNLFLTEKTEKKLEDIKNNIKNKKLLSKVCLITLAENDRDAFEILPLYNLKTCSDRYDSLTIIGIAENKSKAMNICSDIINEYVVENNTMKYASVKEYFMDKYL